MKLIIQVLIVFFTISKLVHCELREEVKSVIEQAKTSGSQVLDLSYQEIEDEELVEIEKMLEDVPKIKYLNLHANSIGHKGLEGFSVIGKLLKKKNIERVTLSNNWMYPDTMAPLAEGLDGSNVTYLDLAFNGIGAKGVTSLAKILENTQIRTLNLSMTNIFFRGAIALAEVLPKTKIVDLNLHGNNIQNSGATSIAKALSQSKLQSLNLQQNLIGDSGAIAIAGALKDSKLTSLKLRINRLGEPGMKALEESLKNNFILLNLDVENKTNGINRALARNQLYLTRAKRVVNRYLNGNIRYISSYRPGFKAFLNFADLDVLWEGVENFETVKEKIKQEIQANYSKIFGEN